MSTVWEEQERQYNQLMQEDNQYCHPESFKWGFEHGVEYALTKAGWRPGSELPPKEGEYITIMSNSLGEHGEIGYNDFSNGEWRYIGYDWEPREVLFWCYPPEEG